MIANPVTSGEKSNNSCDIFAFVQSRKFAVCGVLERNAKACRWMAGDVTTERSESEVELTIRPAEVLQKLKGFPD